MLWFWSSRAKDDCAIQDFGDVINVVDSGEFFSRSRNGFYVCVGNIFDLGQDFKLCKCVGIPSTLSRVGRAEVPQGKFWTVNEKCVWSNPAFLVDVL